MLVRANKDFIIEAYSQKLHLINMTFTCPNNKYVICEGAMSNFMTTREVNGKVYREKLKLLIDNPFAKALKIKMNKSLPRFLHFPNPRYVT